MHSVWHRETFCLQLGAVYETPRPSHIALYTERFGGRIAVCESRGLLTSLREARGRKTVASVRYAMVPY